MLVGEHVHTYMMVFSAPQVVFDAKVGVGGSEGWVGINVYQESCQILSSSVIAFDIELCFAWEIFYLCLVILVTFYVT